MTEKETDLVIITKEEYKAIALSIARTHLINLRYQSRCKCDINFEDLA
jgi:hypothetical protein